jgi:hypothetical protein
MPAGKYIRRDGGHMFDARMTAGGSAAVISRDLT